MTGTKLIMITIKFSKQKLQAIWRRLQFKQHPTWTYLRHKIEEAVEVPYRPKGIAPHIIKAVAKIEKQGYKVTVKRIESFNPYK